MGPVQTGSETVSGNVGMSRPETKRSGDFGKIPDQDWDRWVWSGPDWVPISLGPNFPNTNGDMGTSCKDKLSSGYFYSFP